MKKTVPAAIFLVLTTVTAAWAVPPETADLALPPSKSLMNMAQPMPYVPVSLFAEKLKTPAFEQYKRRPVSELSKLIYLGDLLKQSKFVIVHGGMTYYPKIIASMVTMYVRMNYKNEKAEDWIAKHAYRNGPSYAVLYVRDPQGKMTLLRDLLLEELKSLS